MNGFIVYSEDGKTYSHYFIENGRYYVQSTIWWEKGGYAVPQGKHRTSKADYEMMKAFAESQAK